MKRCDFMIFLILIAFNFYFIDAISIDRRSIFIEEGTRWCGKGNIAKNCSDLGVKAETDACCREHDYCPYTYTAVDGLLQGFQWLSSFTLSNCECDKKFHDCLSETPIKFGSQFVKSAFFDGLKVKCFMYIPCKPDEIEYSSIWLKGGQRRIGECLNNMKIRVFESIEEYDHYMLETLSYEKKLLLKEILQQPEKLMNLRKATAPCLNDFTYLYDSIVNSFEKSYLNSVNDHQTITDSPENSDDFQIDPTKHHNEDTKDNSIYVVPANYHGKSEIERIDPTSNSTTNSTKTPLLVGNVSTTSATIRLNVPIPERLLNALVIGIVVVMFAVLVMMSCILNKTTKLDEGDYSYEPVALSK